MKLRLFLLAIVFFLFSCTAYSDRYIPKSDLVYNVLKRIETQYVDPSRLKPEPMLKSSLEQLSKEIAPVVVQYQLKKTQVLIDIRVDTSHKKFQFPVPKDLNGLNDILQEIVRFTKLHLEKNVKLEKVDYAVINGFLDALDPHTTLLVPQIYSEFSTTTQGNFGGVGMLISIRDGKLTIVAPIDDTPAAKAGLRAKDQIVQIDEESTINLSLTDAVKKLRGKRGTPVNLYIMREGFSAPKKYVIVRDNIKITSVESHIFKEKKKRIGYIKLKGFQQNSLSELNAHLKKMDHDFSDFAGLILDLRNNPGGLLDQAIQISDRFLSHGVIVSTAGLDPKSIQDFKARWFRTINKMPIVILVNNGSASASEIVSAALKKNKRAIVIGTQTFGKGSVQQIYPMADGSALKLTTAKYLTPGKTSIQSVGVTPNVKIQPYFINHEFLKVTSNGTERSESKLARSFSEWSGKKEKADKTIFYLYEEEKKSKKTEEEDFKKAKIRRLKKDFLIRFAKKVLLKKQGKGYADILGTALTISKEEENRQEERMIQKFASLKIDWKKYPYAGKNKNVASKLWVEIEKTVKGKKVWEKLQGAIPADSNLRVYVEVTNQGKTDIPRLVAVSSSKNLLFHKRQFVFGKVASKESKSWYTSLKVSKAMPSRNDLIKLKILSLASKKNKEVAKTNHTLSIKQNAIPEYSYQLELFENGQFGSKGNKNGLIEKGETVTLKVTVKNHAKGDSGRVTLLLKNGEGKAIFLRKGRSLLKTLKSGESKSALFTFDVKKELLDGKLDLSLDIIDSTYYISSINHKLRLPLNAIKKKIVNHPPTIHLNQATLSTKLELFNLNGFVLDDKAVKDIYIFSNNKKVYYQNFKKAQNRKKIQFKILLKLQKNMNQVVIFSRDNQDVVSRRTLYLRRTEK